jgi:hypothetical protein
MRHTTYSDKRGEFEAIFMTWGELADILGRPYWGIPADDSRICDALIADGAPAWVKKASGWAEPDGYGLIGPAIDEVQS